MKTIANIFFFLFVITFISSCNDMETVSSNNPVLSLSEEECLFIAANTPNHTIKESQALEIAKQINFSNITRGNNPNTDIVQVLTKANFGISDNPKYEFLPDTIAYLCYENDGYYSIVAADNRLPQQYFGYIKKDLLFPTSNSNEELDLSDFVRESFLQSLNNTIISYEMQKDSINKVIVKKLSNIIEDINAGSTTRALDDPEIFIDYGNWFVEIVDEILTPWELVLNIGPLLHVEWGQGNPYNIYVKDTLNCNNTTGVPTGCVATATAMLTSYWHQPQSINGTTLDWNSILLGQYPFTSDAIHQVGVLMKAIGVECETTYGCGGSYTNLDRAKTWLLSHGYTGGNKSGFADYKVISSLSQMEPVLIGGLTSSGEGHSWVIDGVKKYKRTIHRYYRCRDYITEQSYMVDGGIMDEYMKLLNSNFGNYNAVNWLTSGVFQEENYGSGSYTTYSNNLQIYTHYRPTAQ